MTTDIDWGAVAVAVALFVMLSPGMAFQLPAKKGFIKSFTFETSAVSILFHSLIYLALAAFFFLFIGVHLFLGHSPALKN